MDEQKPRSAAAAGHGSIAGQLTPERPTNARSEPSDVDCPNGMAASAWREGGAPATVAAALLVRGDSATAARRYRFCLEAAAL
jgi:hypothetical protein